MKTFRVVWKNLLFNFSSSTLGVLLSALGTAIFCLVLLLSSQINRQMMMNGRQIDLVIGAKGSPLQLILNSIYHVDYPTGNILLEDARKIAQHPLVKRAVPLSMGDNYQGFRIVGTDSGFLALYDLRFAFGKWIVHDFESVVGYEVARAQHLHLGDQIIGAHGLTDSEDLHADHPYTVVGIMERSGTVADKLVLTNLSSVWHMHEHEHHHAQGYHEHHQEGDEKDQNDHVHHEPQGEEHTVHGLLDIGNHGHEITSMLIQYKNPTAVALFPRMVNQQTQMQAASPAIESARLFTIMGIGLDALRILAFVLMAMAVLSVFVSLYNAFKSRKYELAVMRTMGASRGTLFKLMITEGILVTMLGAVLGILLAHLTAFMISSNSGGNMIRPGHFGVSEIVVALAGLLLGFIAALIPAIKAYSTPISQTLSR